MIPGYHLTIASVVGKRDGMSLEVTDSTGEQVAEVFEDDDTGKRVVNLFTSDVPVEVMEWLLARAKTEL